MVRRQISSCSWVDFLSSQSNVRFYSVSLEVIWMTGVSDAPRFAYSTKLGEDRHMLEGRATIQTLIGWNIAWTRTVWALDKDTVLHLGWNNPSTSAVWGLTLVSFSFFSSAEKDIGILVGASQMNQQSILAVAKPNWFMGCISKNLPSRTKD